MDVEKFINEIYIRAPIWDQKSSSYHNRDIIAKLWQEVATSCEITVDLAKSKWKHLRDNFRAELRKIGKKKSGDAGGSQASYESTWVWFKLLLFLKNQMIGRKMQGNLPRPIEETKLSTSEESEDNLDVRSEHNSNGEQEHIIHEETQTGTDTSTTAVKFDKKTKRTRNTTDNVLLDIERKKIKLIEHHLQSSQTPVLQDDCYHFLMSLQKPLSNLPVERQMYVRFKIQELIYNETSNALNYQHFSSNFTPIHHSEYINQPTISSVQHPEYSNPASTSSVQSNLSY